MKRLALALLCRSGIRSLITPERSGVGSTSGRRQESSASIFLPGRFSIFLILSLALAACGTPLAAPTPSLVPTPTSPTAPLPAGTLVIFNREGGIAFTSKTLTILLDGNARLEDSAQPAPKEWQISADQLASLRLAFDDPGFAESPFDTIVNCDDCYVDTLTALTSSGPKAARVDQADIFTGNNVTVPPALTQAITLLVEIMNSAP